MQELWQAFGHTITNILPKSPFAGFIRALPEWPALGWLNWLLPVEDILKFAPYFDFVNIFIV